MIYRNITVDIPQKKRIKRTGNFKNGEYPVYEIISRKKHTTDKNDNSDEKDIVKNVGVLAVGSEGKMHPNDNYFLLHPECKPIGKADPGVFDDVMHVGADFVLERMIEELELDQVLYKAAGDKSELILSLIHYYLIGTSPAGQLYKYFAYNHYTGPNFIPSESMISNLYNHDIDAGVAASFLEMWMSRQIEKTNPEATIVIDYDSTSINTYSEGIGLAEYGYSKDDEDTPQFNIAYIVNRETGIPFYYDLYYGSVVDTKHIGKMKEKIDSFHIRNKILYVLDRGYFSRQNIRSYINKKIRYLCMGKDNSEVDKLIDRHGNNLRNNAEYWIPEHETCGMRIYGCCCKDMEDVQKQYIYLYYSDEKADIEKKRYNAKQNYAYNYCKELLEKGTYDTDGKIEKTYDGKYVNLSIDKNDRRLIGVSRNIKSQTQAWKMCGYFWIVSSERKKPEEILDLYRHRDEIEKCFKTIKSGIGFDKYYSQDERAVESKTLVSFLCAIVKTKLLQYARKYIYSHSGATVQTILCELDKICIYTSNKVTMYKYNLTKSQREVLGCFGLGDAFLRKKLSEYIAKRTEKKDDSNP